MMRYFEVQAINRTMGYVSFPIRVERGYMVYLCGGEYLGTWVRYMVKGYF